MIFNKDIKHISIKLNKILQTGDILKVDEFVNEFLKIDKNNFKKETSLMIKIGCKQLIENVFLIVILNYGKQSNMSIFSKVVNNTNGEGIQITKKLNYIKLDDIYINNLKDQLYLWMMNDYYNYCNYHSQTYRYTLPVRYWTNKINRILYVNNDLIEDIDCMVNKKVNNPILEDAVVMDNNNKLKDIISTPDIEDDIEAKSKNSVVIEDNDDLQGTIFNLNKIELEGNFRDKNKA